MDIYQIIITHNRSWTIREIIAFAVVFLITAFIAVILLRQKKIIIMQAVSCLLLLTFLAVIFVQEPRGSDSISWKYSGRGKKF